MSSSHWKGSKKHLRIRLWNDQGENKNRLQWEPLTLGPQTNIFWGLQAETNLPFFVLSVWPVFNWVSKVNCVCFGFAILRSVIGQQNSRHFFNQWKPKPKPIVSCRRAFSRALRRCHVIASNSDWLTEPFRSVVIGRSNCFGFGYT